MACLGKVEVQACQVPREPLVTSLVLKMVLQGSKAYKGCQGTEDFLETLAFQDPRVCLGSQACLAPKVSGAGLEHQATWDIQAPQGLVVYSVSRANPDSQEHQAFQALQVTKERLASLGHQACLDLLASPAPSRDLLGHQAPLAPQDCGAYLA
ncbi:hypothetical protein MC885_005254 [Smutsia gigantea]|nr:hypothetical protein MC885_005254 [Smutsia gigantea]